MIWRWMATAAMAAGLAACADNAQVDAARQNAEQMAAEAGAIAEKATADAGAMAAVGTALASALREVPNSCPAALRRPWGPSQQFVIEATVQGPSCDKAVVSLVIRRTDGTVELTESYGTASVFGLADAADPAAMDAALTEWVIPAERATQSTATLPEWAAGAGQPGGEFPFLFDADQAFTRADWERLRTEALPMLCWPQGMESMACHVLREDRIDRIGVQTFPG